MTPSPAAPSPRGARDGVIPPPEGPPPPPRVRTEWRQAAVPTAVSFAVAFAVLAGLSVWITGSPDWPRVERQFFSWEAMTAAFPRVLRGFWINMQVWLVLIVAIGVWALVLAVIRALRGPWFTPLRLMVVIYIDLFRGLPALLMVLLFGFGIPALNLPGLPSSGLFWASVAMVLCYSAYVCEIYRAGIEAVHEGQALAARALGLTEGQAMRWCILPQALRNALPSLMNIVVALQKDVALLSVIGVRDAVREAQIYTAATFNYSSLLVAAFLFLLATIPMARLADHVSRADRARRLGRGA